MRFSNQIVFLVSCLLYSFVHSQILTDSLHDGGSLPSERQVFISSDDATRKPQFEEALDRGVFDSEVDSSSDTNKSARVKRTLYLNSHAASVKSKTTQPSAQLDLKPHIFIIKQQSDDSSRDPDETRSIIVVYQPRTNKTQISQTTRPSSTLTNRRLRLSKIRDNISHSLFKSGTPDRLGIVVKPKYLDTLSSNNGGHESLNSWSRLSERRKDTDFLRRRLLSDRIGEINRHIKTIEQAREPRTSTTTTVTTYRPITVKRRWREAEDVLDPPSGKRGHYA